MDKTDEGLYTPLTSLGDYIDLDRDHKEGKYLATCFLNYS